MAIVENQAMIVERSVDKQQKMSFTTSKVSVVL